MRKLYKSKILFLSIILLTLFSVESVYALPIKNDYVLPTPPNGTVSTTANPTVTLNVTSDIFIDGAYASWGNASGVTNVNLTIGANLIHASGSFINLGEYWYHSFSVTLNNGTDINTTEIRYYGVDSVNPTIGITTENVPSGSYYSTSPYNFCITPTDATSRTKNATFYLKKEGYNIYTTYTTMKSDSTFCKNRLDFSPNEYTNYYYWKIYDNANLSTTSSAATYTISSAGYIYQPTQPQPQPEVTAPPQKEPLTIFEKLDTEGISDRGISGLDILITCMVVLFVAIFLRIIQPLLLILTGIIVLAVLYMF